MKGWRGIALGVLALSITMLWVAASPPPPVNPPAEPGHSLESAVYVPSQVSEVLRRSCYDCHSNETRWPWYGQLPGFGKLVFEDVQTGRSRMNFSSWPKEGREARLGAVRLMAICAAVRQEAMPPLRYRLLHPESALTPAESEAICAWAYRGAAALRQPTPRNRP